MTSAARPLRFSAKKTARHFWPQEDALGKRVRSATPRQSLAHSGRHRRKCSRRRRSRRSARNVVLAVGGSKRKTPAAHDLIFMVRTRADALSGVASVQQAIWRVRQKSRHLRCRCHGSLLLGFARTRASWCAGHDIFGVFGLLLAALGVYGVMSFVVTQRTREIGVRVALGAGARNILDLVLRRGIRLTIYGLALGFFAAVALNRVLNTFLLGVQHIEYAMLFGACLVLLGIASAACYLPSRRAARLVPARRPSPRLALSPR